jgi:hypothetical protein
VRGGFAAGGEARSLRARVPIGVSAVVGVKRLVVVLAFAFPSLAGARTLQPWPSGVAWRSSSFAVRGTVPVLTGTVVAQAGVAYVAWIDHERTRLALYPGLSEPPSAPLRGPAQVPSGQRWRLLATFNGGFKSATDAGGMVVNGTIESPLRTGMGTLVEYRDGTVAILDWLGRTSPRKLVLARQNLPPLVWGGRPSVRVFDPSLWGVTLGGFAVWRTGVGITKRGDLVYAAGDSLTPAALASIFVRLGAVRAVELDINPEWPSFIAYGRRGGRNPVKVVPNPQQSSWRYLTPDHRDFFAVYARPGGGSLVPFR